MTERAKRLISTLRPFLILRGLEFIFATTILTAVPFVSSGSAPTVGELAKAVTFMSMIGGVYVVFAYYLPFVFAAFLVVGFTARLTRTNIPFVNSAPFLIHSLPIMLGYFGGLPPEPPFWIGWLMIVVFNFLIAKATTNWTLPSSSRLVSAS